VGTGAFAPPGQGEAQPLPEVLASLDEQEKRTRHSRRVRLFRRKEILNGSRTRQIKMHHGSRDPHHRRSRNA